MGKKNKRKSAGKMRAGQINEKKSSKEDINMHIKEHRLKTSPPKCKVTFRLSKKEAPKAQEVTIVWDFNNWDITETPMKKLKNGDFMVTLELSCNREYKFRYLIDPKSWLKDWNIDKCVPGSYICDD